VDDETTGDWITPEARMPILTEAGIGSGIWALNGTARPVVLVHLKLLYPGTEGEEPLEESIDFGLLADSAQTLSSWMSSVATQVQATLS